MQIQSNLGSTIAMAFDECPPSLADRDYVQKSVERTTRWLARCKDEMARLNALPDTVNREQLLFGINQGGDLRGYPYRTREGNQQNEPRRLCGRRSGSWREP